MKTTTAAPAISSSRDTAVIALARKIIHRLDAVPYALLALPLRLGVAIIFWNSAMGKLANWDTTLYMFTEEYKVPLLPPEIAAQMALMVELVCPPLLLLGLATRPACIVLLGMTSVIQIFVFPDAWPTHIQWVAMLLVLLCRGAGALSLDRFIARRLFATPRP